MSVRSASEGQTVAPKTPDWFFLRGLIGTGEIDVLHTWGDFPHGGFSRDLVEQGFPLLERDQIRFTAWTAHGGENDMQNLAPLGGGDDEQSPYFHMDYTQRLGVQFFSRNTDIVVSRPPRIILDGIYFKRFRGPSKAEVHSVSLKDLPKQIALAEERTIWHPPVDDVIIYTHFYTEEDHGSPQGWKPVLEFHVPEEADTCLRKLAERNDQGELEVLSLTKLLRGV